MGGYQEPFNSRKAEYIRGGIRDRIRQSSVTLVYLSEHTAESEWVNWEIRESTKLGKGVIGVYKGDDPPRVLPTALKESRVPLVRWTHKGVAAAIEKAAKEALGGGE